MFAPLTGDEPTLALVAVDLGWFQHLPDAVGLRATILEETGLADAALLLNLSHTHAGANVNSQLADKPGSELIQPYIEHLTEQISAAILEARAGVAPAWVTYGTGRCALAANRDLWDAEAQRFAAGYNPDAPADDTLLVARVTGEDGDVHATLFNYACHPTTLAWENRLLSPDYIGAAREVLEGAFGAPALFLQGASGELAPRDDYVGDPAVADRNGRQLGHAAAAAIESLPPPGTRFVYTGIQASGANLGTWAYEACEPAQVQASERLAARVATVELRRKDDIGVIDSLAGPDSVQEQEKALRRRFLSEALGDSPVYPMPIWIWRLGGARLVAIPNEPYSVLQTELRSRLDDTPLLVLGVTNSTMGYLCPQETYGSGLYQEQQSPFAPGCLEQTIEVAAQALEELLVVADAAVGPVALRQAGIAGGTLAGLGLVELEPETGTRRRRHVPGVRARGVRKELVERLELHPFLDPEVRHRQVDMEARRAVERRAGVVEGGALSVHLSGRENLLRLRDAAGMNQVDPQVVDELVLDQRLELPLVRELLARRDRQIHLVADGPQRHGVERTDRVLVEVEAMRLERPAEVGRFRGAEHRVRVEDQVDVVADRAAQRLRRLDRLDDRGLGIPVPERVVVERGERAEAQRGESLLSPAKRVLRQLGRGGSRQVAVDPHPLARRAAEEVVDRDAEPLPLEIPEGDVDPGDRAHDHLPGRPERAPYQLAPPVLDPRRVLPDQAARRSGRGCRARRARPRPGSPRRCPSAPRRCGRGRSARRSRSPRPRSRVGSRSP